MNTLPERTAPDGVGYSYGFGALAHPASLAAPSASTMRARRLSIAEICYLLIALAGWFATTFLTTCGLFVVLFALAGNGSLDGFFAQVERLAWHYLAADAARRASFDGQALVVALTVLFATGFFRRASLISIFRTGGVDGPQHADRG